MVLVYFFVALMFAMKIRNKVPVPCRDVTTTYALMKRRHNLALCFRQGNVSVMELEEWEMYGRKVYRELLCRHRANRFIYLKL